MMNDDTAIVTGIGYLNTGGYGTVRKGIIDSCSDIRDVYEFLKGTPVLAGSIKNFGRFNDESRRACMTAGLALLDSNMPLGTDDVGIMATDSKGAAATNFNYYKDFYDCGRSLGRGNLFIYTLPTSPLAEASICYGLNGPLVYMTGTDNSAAFILSQARDMLNANRAHAMLAVSCSVDESICFVIEKTANHGQDKGLRVDMVLQRLNECSGSVSDLTASLIEARK